VSVRRAKARASSAPGSGADSGIRAGRVTARDISMSKAIAEIIATLDTSDVRREYVIHCQKEEFCYVPEDIVRDVFTFPADVENVWFRFYDKPTVDSVRIAMLPKGSHGVCHYGGKKYDFVYFLQNLLFAMSLLTKKNTFYVELLYED